MIFALILEVFLSGVSLAMDAFAVSICDGMIYQNMSKKKGVLIPLTFGLFQAFMPIIGFYVGMAFSQFETFDIYDHWIAFALLIVIGGKMIYDGAKELRAKEEAEIEPKNFSYPAVLVQGVATSIDALFVGFGLNTMITNALPEITSGGLQGWAWLSVLIIGVTTFIISAIGVFVGVKVGKIFKKKASIAEIIGGAVLILIGVKLVLSGCGVIPF